MLDREEIVTQHLQSAKLSGYLQCLLPLNGYCYADFEVDDGSQVAAVTALAKSVRSEVLKQEIDFRFQVRAAWLLESVEEVLNTHLLEFRYRVTLNAGGFQKDVIVRVPYRAADALRQRVARNANLTGVLGCEESEIVRKFVKNAIGFQLSQKGQAFYWDPLQDPEWLIPESAVDYYLVRWPYTDHQLP